MSQIVENPGNEISVKIDASELQKVLAEMHERQLAELRELLKPKVEEKPVTVTVTESANNERDAFARWLEESVRVKEAVAGVPTSFTYKRDLIVIPPSIGAGLRRYAQVVEVGRGEAEARFYKINVPPFAALTSKTAPTEVSQTITTVTASLVERGAMQVVGYEEIERSVVNLVGGIEETFTVAAANDMDKLILTELDTNTNEHFAGGRTAENQVTGTDTLKLAELIAAKRKLIQNAKRVPEPGGLVLVCHPKQYHDLLSDTNVIKAMEFGGEEPVRTGTIPQVLGIRVIPTDLVSTGTGASSTTTYRAHLFFPKAFGLAISRDLMIEAFREPPRRAISIIASYVAGAKLIEPNYALKVITA